MPFRFGGDAVHVYLTINNECIRQAQATGPGYDPAPDEGPTGLWPAANMFPDPAALPGAMPMETPDRPGPAQDAGMDGPAIGA